MDLMDLLILLLLALPAPALAAVREFHYVNLLKTWTEAQSYCREKFIDLVTIENEADLARATTLAQNSADWGAWIGLYRLRWRWSLDNTYLFDQELESWFDFLENGGGIQQCVDLYNGIQLHDNYCHYQQKSVCYNENTGSYIAVTDLKTWQEAQSYCRQTHTDLAIIRNQQEWDKVINAVTTSGRHWIGLSMQLPESWKWSDQSNSSFWQWATGQPSGGNEACGGAGVDGMHDAFCEETLPFICSAPQRKVLKVTLKTDGSMNPNDPLVQEGILKQMEKDLKGQQVNPEFKLRWKKQPHGDVFNKTQL